jgi:DNA end-binding protein Ku
MTLSRKWRCMGGKHVAIIRPARDGIVLHTMYYASELRKPMASEKSDRGKITLKEMELAKKLIGSLAAPFKPEQYRDRYRENLEQLIQQKQNGEKPKTVKQPKNAPVVDILEALQRSLASKKPQAKEAPKRRRGRTAA